MYRVPCLKEQECKYNLMEIYCLRPFLLVANNVTMAVILIGYKVVQSTHYHCEVVIPKVINCFHGNHCGRLCVSSKVLLYGIAINTYSLREASCHWL